MGGLKRISYILMNLERLIDIIEKKLEGIKIRLRYNTIYRSKQVVTWETNKLVKAIHIELDLVNFKENFTFTYLKNS